MKESKSTSSSGNRRQECDSKVTAQYEEFCSLRYEISRDGACGLENGERTAEGPSKGRMHQTPALCYIILFTNDGPINYRRVSDGCYFARGSYLYDCSATTETFLAELRLVFPARIIGGGITDS